MKSDTRRWRLSVVVAASFLAGATSLAAQQTTGVPCSPSATTTVDGRYLPNPPAQFGGVINLSARDSKSCWPATVVPPKGAPNVLLIMTDDAGYGISSSFGGVIPTPAMDRIASAGVKYTQFHSTALCSPTRAALITGRNHHSVGFGVISEQATGYPGYNSIIGPENATVGEILRENGYATSWFGKNHNTPAYQYSAAGPVHPVADRDGLRLLLRLHGRRDRPVDAVPVPEHDAGLSLDRPSGIQPDHRHGGRRDRAYPPAEGGGTGAALLRVLRPWWDACTASADARVDRQDPRDAPFRQRLERAPGHDFCQPEAPRRHSRQHAADPVA